MKIYRKHQIQRMAAEMLCKDLMENKNYTFTNTSYGGRGEILGTIATHDDYTRTAGTIQYRLEKNWHTDEAKLVKETELTSYKTETRPYDQQNKVETVLTLFSLNGNDIFTDDKEIATKAQEKRHQRFCLGRYDYSKDNGISGDHEIKVGTPLYEKLFNKVSRIKPVKYGSSISLYVYKTKRNKYDYDANHNCIKREVNVIETTISYVYRGRVYSVNNKSSEYNVEGN